MGLYEINFISDVAKFMMSEVEYIAPAFEKVFRFAIASFI